MIYKSNPAEQLKMLLEIAKEIGDAADSKATVYHVWSSALDMSPKSVEFAVAYSGLIDLAESVRVGFLSRHPSNVDYIAPSLQIFQRAHASSWSKQWSTYWSDLNGSTLIGLLGLAENLLDAPGIVRLEVTDGDSLWNHVMALIDDVARSGMEEAAKTAVTEHLQAVISFLDAGQVEPTSVLVTVFESLTSRVFGDERLTKELMRTGAGRLVVGFAIGCSAVLGFQALTPGGSDAKDIDKAAAAVTQVCNSTINWGPNELNPGFLPQSSPPALEPGEAEPSDAELEVETPPNAG